MSLRARFRQLVENANLPCGSLKSRRNYTSYDLHFASLKLSFAQEIGRTELFRLAVS